MAKRRVKKTASKNTTRTGTEDPHAEKEPITFQDPEVERWSASIRASRDLEIDNLRTGLRLLRSYFSEEQMKTPVLQFFEENLPNFSIIKNGDGNFELERKDNVVNSMTQEYDIQNMNASLLHRMSSFNGLDLISKAVNPNSLSADNLQNNDYMLGELSESQLLGLQDTLQTPGVNSQRLSIGMTPNTVRLPKHGEMLLSVRGSPLGVYNKQEKMEAINESEGN